MKYIKNISLGIVTSVLCLIMMVLEIVVTQKTLPSGHAMFIIMLIAAFIIYIIGVITLLVSDNTIGLGLLILSTFVMMVGCSLPSPNVGSMSEIIIIYIPIVLLASSLICVRGGGNFKRVMIITVSIIYLIVSLYTTVNAISNQNVLFGGDTKGLNIVYGFMSLFFYGALLFNGVLSFANQDYLRD